MASQAVDNCQSREGVDVALNDIEAFLDTAKEYQLPSPEEFHNQFEFMLTLEVKVMLLGNFDPVIEKDVCVGGLCLLPQRIQIGCTEQVNHFLNPQVASQTPGKLTFHGLIKISPSVVHFSTNLYEHLWCVMYCAEVTTMNRNRRGSIPHGTYNLVGEADINVRHEVQKCVPS